MIPDIEASCLCSPVETPGAIVSTDVDTCACSSRMLETSGFPLPAMVVMVELAAESVAAPPFEQPTRRCLAVKARARAKTLTFTSTTLSGSPEYQVWMAALIPVPEPTTTTTSTPTPSTTTTSTAPSDPVIPVFAG